MRNTILHLTPSAEDRAGAGGRTRIVSEVRYAVGQHYPTIILCLVPFRKLLRPRRLARARRALQRDAGTRVMYWPSLPAFGGIRLLETVDSLTVLLVSKWFRIAGIHAQGLSAVSRAL